MLGLEGWRWVTIIAAAGAIFVWWIRLTLPESPRWLAQHGRIADAERITAMIEQRVQAESGRPLPPPEVLPDEVEQGRGSWLEIWRRPYRSRTIMLIVFNLLQSIGYYGFASWLPTFLVSQGITITKSLLYVCHRAREPGRSAARVEHRRPHPAQMAARRLLRISCCLRPEMTTAAGIIVMGVLITFSTTNLSYSFHAFQAKLYPTRIRSRAIGFTYSWSRFSTIFVGFMVAFFLRNYGTTGVFAFIAAAMVACCLVIGLMGPQTTRPRLEQI